MHFVMTNIRNRTICIDYEGIEGENQDMNAKTKHKLAYRYYRLLGQKAMRESSNSYPIGFDCPDRGRCGDMCYCLESALRGDEIFKGVEAEIERLKSLVTPELIAIAESQFMQVYVRQNTMRFVYRVTKYRFHDPRYQTRLHEDGLFWSTWKGQD